MDNFTAYCLRFGCQAVTEIAVPRHKGSMLRGALYRALIDDFCLNKVKENRQQIAFARELRGRQTDAEKALWMRLRDKQLEGVKF